MMVIVRVQFLLLTVLAACYRPSPQAGARCAAEGNRCPSGLTCRAGICVDENAPDDANGDAPRIDARITDGGSPDAIDAVGCADGAREAFTDTMVFPNVAGCAASWNGALGMRAPTTSQACGDDLQLCAAPADACAAGWHVCGSNGQPTELTSRMTQDDCANAGGSNDVDARFAGALSHCVDYNMAVCNYAVPRGCASDQACAEPICCGIGCRLGVGCPSGAFASQGVAGTLMNGCGAMNAVDITGVLCCR